MEEKAVSNEKKEKASLSTWVGVIGGIIGAIGGVWGIFKDVSAPKSASLEFGWSSVDRTELSLSPAHMSSSEALAKKVPNLSGLTVPFPLHLYIKNGGGKTAKNVVLRITHPSFLAISSKNHKLETDSLVGDKPLSLTTIVIEKIDPGEKYITTDLFGMAEDTSRIPVSAETKDHVRIGFNVQMVLTYPVGVAVSAEDVESKDKQMLITIGPDELLQKRGKKFVKVTVG